MASAQDAFFPSYSAELPANGTQPVYSAVPYVTPQQDSVMVSPLTQSPVMSQPPVMTQPSLTYSQPSQMAHQNVETNPRLKPEYIPPIPTSLVVSPAGGYPGDLYLGYWQPGHYRQLTGSPYFYSAPNAGPRGPLAGNSSVLINGSYTDAYNYGSTSSYPVATNYGYPAGNPQGVSYLNSYGVSVSGVAAAGGDPYNYHFGPGFYRSGEYGHYRFPFYSYRRPWYHPGFAGYNRDTNLPW
jgi:hypothetical protein